MSYVTKTSYRLRRMEQV